jgi:hypothetical protein
MTDDMQRHAGKFYGKYSGVVIRNDDDKDNTGRIVVKVPSVFGTDAEVTARPCVPYGYFFIPPVGSKVWVEFEAGHTDYPLWVGTWYPQGTAPQQAAMSPPDNRVIQTASGHTIEISDKAGEEKITIKHRGNSFVTIDKDGSVMIGNNKGSLIVLDAKNDKAVLVEQHGNLVTMDEKGVVIMQKEGKSLVQLTDDTAHVAAPNVVLDGTLVSCGAGAAEPTILGNTFAQMWLKLMTHTHATGTGPSGPPLPPLLPLTAMPGGGLTNAVLVA